MFNIAVQPEIDIIDVLNNSDLQDSTCELEQVFNVQDYLKAIAIDVMTGNWDGPIVNKNNFYLYYNTAVSKFEYLPYDLDNTFGIDWLGSDWGWRNIYSWNGSNHPRPIYTRILSVPKYREQYSFYISQLIDYFNSQELEDRIFYYKDLIQEAAEEDLFRLFDYGYSINDFNNSFYVGITNNGSGHDDDYGIINYLSNRRISAAGQLSYNDMPPVINRLSYANHFQGDLQISCSVFDDYTIDQVRLIYDLDGNNTFSQNFYDNGIAPDEIAADGIYTTSINEGFESIDFYIEATDDSGQVSNYYDCGSGLSIDRKKSDLNLVINEYVADNTSYPDNFGEFEDWIEIFNYGNIPINLNSIYLTDDFNDPGKFKLPNINLGSGDFSLIWADNDPEQGGSHANFKLNKDGEQIGLFEKINDSYRFIHLISYEDAAENQSYGAVVDGDSISSELAYITPGYSNEGLPLSNSYIYDNQKLVYPNPGNTLIRVDVQKELNEIILLSVSGTVYTLNSLDFNSFDVSGLPPGAYLLKLEDQLLKFIKY